MKRALIALLSFTLLIPTAMSFAGVCGDVNDDGLVNIMDIIYLIDFKFKNGPEPACESVIGTATDIDGNLYMSIKIGDQWWMAENLKVTHYRNGEAIPNVTDDATWGGLTTGAYCNYDNDVNNGATYGGLYNWYAVNDGRNIAPDGWHLPSDEEWMQLEMYLGMNQTETDQINWRGTDEGGKLKVRGTYYWDSPNTGATNESGFSGLPGGYRLGTGQFINNIGGYAAFWSSSESSGNHAVHRGLVYDQSGVDRNFYDKHHGFSIRCVKD